MRRLLPLLLGIAACRPGMWSLKVEPWPDGVLDPEEAACDLAFDRVVLVVEDRALFDEAGVRRSGDDRVWAVDLWPDGGASPPIEVGNPRHAAMVLRPGPPGETVLGDVDDAVLGALRDAGHALYVSGSARCGPSVTFAWTLPGPRAQLCTSSTLDVPRGPITEIGWAVAPSALFADHLDAPLDVVPSVALLVGGDEDGDGVTTLEELARFDVEEHRLGVSGADPPRDYAGWLAARSDRIGGMPTGWCLAVP
jgi:hypothetical protein